MLSSLLPFHHQSSQKMLTEEVQRRQLGKSMRNAKRDHDEREMKDAAAQRRKDREDDKKRREEVKRQIEEDRFLCQYNRYCVFY